MEDILVLLLLVLLWWRHRRNKTTRRRRFLVRPIFCWRVRHREYHNLLQEVRLCDAESHFRYLQMSRRTFYRLLAKVGPFLRRRRYQSQCRPEIHPAERLALTIRFLATGNSQASLSFNYKLRRSTICTIVRETCSVIWKVLYPVFVKVPSSEDEWKGISDVFF